MLPQGGATHSVITVALSANIGAAHERVWRALVDPNERVCWDERILGAVDLPPSSRQRHRLEKSHAVASDTRPALRSARYRFQLASVVLVLQDEVVAADRHDRLVSRISIGSLRFDQTMTLYDEESEAGPLTRLGMKIVAQNSIPVLGESLSRLDVQKWVIEYADTTLRQVRKFCEAGT